jgi:AraC-like DNA-binding protein
MWESKKPGIDCDVVLSDKDALIGKWVAQVIRCPQRAEELLLDAAERWVADDTLSTEFINSLVQDGEFGIGERQLRRRIRQQTGKPPNFWRQLYRARVAARNIVSGASPLAIVANDSGYADQAHLSREMRRWFGLSPSLLRATPEQFAQHFNSPDAFSR